MKVEYSPGTVSVLQQLAGPPSTAFEGGGPDLGGGVYRLYVRGSNGLSLYERVVYDADAEAFVVQGDAGGAVTAAAGADGIEWQVDVSSYVGEGFTEVDLILVETLDCSSGCEPLDQLSCGFFEIP